MRLRSVGFLLLAPFAYACGSEGDLTGAGDELPYQTPDVSADAGTGSTHLDATVKPVSRSDGSVSTWVDDPLNADSACAASSVAAEQVVVEEQVQVSVEVQVPAPVALYVMMDRSASMAATLWTPAVQAVTQFVRDPGSSGLDVGLQFFPGTGSCNGTGYSTPAVALAPLPGNADALASALSKQSPTGFGTPIEGALRGITDYCKSFQLAHPNEKCVGVLVTDGKPEFDGCQDGSDQLAAIAAAAWTQSKVRTFAVGLKGADFALLDKIAIAGGAADCDTTSARFSCDVSGGTEKLTAALAKIRDTVASVVTHTELQTKTQQRPLECAWQMPAPGADMTIDKDRVNVTLSGGSSAALNLGRVADASRCQAGAWYFDSATAPTRIIACPQTCDGLKAAGYTDVKILLGCETHVLYL